MNCYLFEIGIIDIGALTDITRCYPGEKFLLVTLTGIDILFFTKPILFVSRESSRTRPIRYKAAREVTLKKGFSSEFGKLNPYGDTDWFSSYGRGILDVLWSFTMEKVYSSNSAPFGY